MIGTLFEASELIELKELESAEKLIADARARLPNSILVRTYEGFLLLKQGKSGEARLAYIAVDQAEGVEAGVRSLVRNNIAWLNFELRLDELKNEADQFSAEALRSNKQAGWAIGTRGAVLFWLGHHASGLSFSEQAYAVNTSRESRASNACVAALSCCAMGKLDLARHWFERARTMDGKCKLLPEVEAAVAPAAVR